MDLVDYSHRYFLLDFEHLCYTDHQANIFVGIFFNIPFAGDTTHASIKQLIII